MKHLKISSDAVDFNRAGNFGGLIILFHDMFFLFIAFGYFVLYLSVVIL